MKPFRICCGLILISLFSVVFSQEPENENQSPREQVVREFDRKAPKVGQPIPDVQLLDARGKSFSTANLRGSYTVLVFGCMT